MAVGPDGPIVPHFSPCGAIVEWIRTAYSAPCQWYPGGPVGRIRWYFVPETNAHFDAATVFWPYSQELQLDNPDQPGERTGKVNRPFYRGTNRFPSRDGSHVHGDLIYFDGETPAPWSGDATPPTAFVPCDLPGVFVFPSAGSVTLQGLPPLSPSIEVLEASAASLVLAGQLAAIRFDAFVAPVAGSIFLTGELAVAGPVTVLTVGSPGTLAFVGEAPSVSCSSNVTPGVGVLRITGQQPAVGEGAVLAASSGTLSVAGETADVSAGSVVVVTAPAVLAISGQAPAAVALIVAPPAASLALAGQASIVTLDSLVSPSGTGSLSLTGLPPARLGDRLFPSAGALAFAGRPVTLAAAIAPSGGAASLSFAGRAPLVFVRAFPSSGSVAFVGRAGSLSGNGTVTLLVSGDLALAGHVPSPKVKVSTSAGSLALAGQAPTLTVPSTPAPGSSCSGAVSATLPISFSGTLGAGGQAWWKFSATNGTQYHLRVTFSGLFAGASAHCFEGVCPLPATTDAVRTTSGCTAWTETGNHTVFLAIFNTSGTLTYTVEVATGPC